MRFAPLALLCLCPFAFAGGVDGLLRDLSNDDPSVRDAAEEALWNGDGSALEECREFLKKTEDPEVRDRLAPIVDWLAVARHEATLAKVWKDRWFVAKRDGKVIGVEHQTAVLETVGARRTWVFTSVADLADDGAPAMRARVRVRARHDPGMTAVEAETEVRADGQLEREMLKFDGAKITRGGVNSRPRWRRDDPDDLVLSGNAPAIPEEIATEFLERAVIAGLEKASWQQFTLAPEIKAECAPKDMVVVGEEPVKRPGGDVKAVHVRVGSSHFWISRTEGLLFAKVEDAEIELSDEATCRAAGLDPSARRAARGKRLVADYVAEKNEVRRDSRYRALLNCPEALGACREALATADGETKTRLEAAARWLDPAFGRAELAALRRERWFVGRRDGNVVATERETLAADGDAWSWAGDLVATDLGRHVTTFTLRTASDPWTTPLAMARHAVVEDAKQTVTWTFVDEEFRMHRGGDATADVIDSGSLRNQADEPFVLDFLVAAAIERASLARLLCLEMNVVVTSERAWERTTRVAVMFEGERQAAFLGKTVTARRYVGAWGEWLVTDEFGVVSVLTNGVLMEQVAKDEYEKTLREDEERRRKEAELQVQTLVTADAGARDELEQKLLDAPEARDAVAKALAGAPDADARARLERIGRWLDPAFERERFAKLWTSRTASWKRNGADVGDVAITGAWKDGDWSFTFDGDPEMDMPPGGKVRMAFTSSGPRLTPRSLTLDMKAEGMSVVARFNISRHGMSGTVEMSGPDGVERQDAGENEFGGDMSYAPTFANMIPLVLERASAAGLERLDLCVLAFKGKPDLVRHSFRFKGEEKLKLDDREVTVRRYASEPADGKTEGEFEFWLSPEEGVLKARAADLELRLKPADPGK